MTRMASPGRARSRSRHDPSTTADLLVHGVVPAGTSVPLPEIEVVCHGSIAGLVRQADRHPSSSARRALLTHAELLDGIAATHAVLPLRFGTVVPSRDAAACDLLAPYHDAFAAGLTTLAGRAQFTVRAKYQPEAILREVLARDPGTRRLHQRLHTRHGSSDHRGRVALGEQVAQALMAIREADAALLTDSLSRYATLTSVQPPSSVEGYRIADAAFLVDLNKQEAFEVAAERLARRWSDRARVRLLGPMAAYHFADRLIYGPIEGS